MLGPLLIVSVLSSSVWGGPSPAVPGAASTQELSPQPTAAAAAAVERGVSPAWTDTKHTTAAAPTVSLSATAPDGTVSLDQVVTALTGFYESTIQSATAASQAKSAATLAEVAQSLAEVVSSQAKTAKSLERIQQDLVVVSGRLDAVQDSHTALQKMQGTLSSRLDALQENLGEASGRFEAMRNLSGQLTAASDVSSSLSGRFDSLLESQGALSGRLDTLRDSQTELSQRLDDLSESRNVQSGQLVAVKESLSALSGQVGDLQASQTALARRVDTIQVTQTALSSRMDTLMQARGAAAGGGHSGEGVAVCDRLDAIQTAVSRLPWRVLGEPCRHDSECSALVSEAVCGSERLCVCGDGFLQESNTVCRKNPRLSESCSETAQCQILTPGAVCTGGVCGCPADYRNHNDTECQPIVAKGGICTVSHQCSSGATCESGRCSCRVARHGQYEFRLAGTSSCNYGRVELRQLQGSWGLVCDDSWGVVDGNVFCKSLGFSSGDPKSNSVYGRGTNFYMDNVDCNGRESNLMDCNYNGWGKHNCGDGEVAGVVCS